MRRIRGNTESERKSWEKISDKNIEKENEADIIELNDQQLGAILKYKSFESYVINNLLRETDNLLELTKEQQNYINALDEALKRVKKYNGTLIRCVDFSTYKNTEERVQSFMSDYTVGKTIKIKQYWSTSKEEGYLENPQIKIYIEDTKRERDISSIGLDENEVLYERNSEFKVISKVLVGTIWHIVLKEVN